jgi:ubiquinone/menaquinone biosynthesis C-methylase UbiE
VSSNDTFHAKSYHSHYEQYKKYASGGENEPQARTWLKEDTVDAWRHQRMYGVLDPILIADPQARWLTVGDGRYGNDAKYISNKGGHALASDISDCLLKEAKDIGYIAEYKKENAEALSFQDAEFDYVLCKESYHHFPRPMIALYEMLRVASKGVVLIEPNDRYINDSVLRVLARNINDKIQRLLHRKPNRHAFEDSGNYVFSISRREIEKVALGTNYKLLAFKGFNDVYLAGAEYEKLTAKGPLQARINLLISRADGLCSLGIRDYGMLAAIIFKEEPSKKLLQQLAATGYEIVQLPENPYVSSAV